MTTHTHQTAPTQFVEPPWKAILANKGILPLLWEMFPRHPNLLPAYFDDDPAAATLGGTKAASSCSRWAWVAGLKFR